MENHNKSKFIALLFIPILSIADVNLAISQFTFLISVTLLFILVITNLNNIEINYSKMIVFSVFFIMLLIASLYRYEIYSDLDEQLVVRVFKLIIFFLYFFVSIRIVFYTDVDECLSYIKVFLSFLTIHILLLAWQYFAFKFGFYFPDIGKTTVHGVNSTIKDNLTHRLTGIANEPSYMARALLQIMLLSFFFLIYDNKKKYMFFILLFVSFFLGVLTFSMSFIFSLFIVLVFYIVRTISLKNALFLSTLIVTILAVLYLKLDFYIFDFVLDRFVTESSGSSARSHDLLLAPSLFFENCSLVTCFVGFGPSSFKYFNQWFDSYLIYDTTNNVLVDVLVEFGLLSFVLLSYLFIKYFTLVFKYKVSFLYALVFLLSNLFRSDYLTFNYYTYLVIGFMLLKVERSNG